MKRITLFIIFIFLFTACNKNVDDEALGSISDSLQERWKLTDELPDKISIEDLEKITQTELEQLNKYAPDDFKDTELFILYNNYIKNLEDMLYLVQSKNINDPELQNEWRTYLENRAKILHDIDEKYTIAINDEYSNNFKDVLKDSERLVETEKIEGSLKQINEEISVFIEGDSILIEYPTESVLSADSFVAQKTGFPGTAMKILEMLKDYDYEDIVIATINQGTIAISSYFTNNSLNKINLIKWEELDSYDGYEFYKMTDDFHVRSGVMEQISDEFYNQISNITKSNNNQFWTEHGFTHDL